FLAAALLLRPRTGPMWAAGVQPGGTSDGYGETETGRALDRIDAMESARIAVPRASPRPRDFSPFGEAFKDGAVRAPGDAPGRLRQDPDVAFFQAMPPGDKIALDTARRPLIEEARGADPNLLLEVALVPGSDVASVRGDLARLPGVVNVAEYGPEGSSFLVRADYRSVGRLARIPEVLSVQESLEMMTLNARNVPAIQTGSAQQTNEARPFDDIGVDGGGIDTNNDGQRINDGSDA